MSSDKGHLTVISCGIGQENLTDMIRKTVSDAAILAGGQRLLDLFADHTGEKIVIGKSASETIAKLANMVIAQEKEVCVLASGDSLFHGIGKTFSKLIPKDKMTIIPNITAMQSFAAKLCIPWDKASFFSMHGRHSGMPWHTILASHSAIIYCDPKNTAANIAKNLLEKFPKAGNRFAVIAEDLGLSSEKIIKGTLTDIASKTCSGLSILALLPSDGSKVYDAGLSLGLPDSDFSHEKNLITHSEVRAVALSKLHLGPGVMWDIGAGSGSVGIEAAGLCKDLTVYSVEKNKDRIKDIKANVEEFGLGNIVIKSGKVQEVIDDLPAPRAVFIGGGGEAIEEILKNSYDKLLPGGYIVATAVLLETRSALSNSLKDQCTEVVSLSVSRSKILGNSRMMKSDNNIEIFVYEK